MTTSATHVAQLSVAHVAQTAPTVQMPCHSCWRRRRRVASFQEIRVVRNPFSRACGILLSDAQRADAHEPTALFAYAQAATCS